MTDLQPIQTLIATAEEAMIGRSSDDASTGDANGFLFTGSLQQSVPEALIFSSALQAVDVRVWMAMRAMIVNPRTPGCLPKRGELAESINVSAPTVSAALANLRCLRWLTLCREVRNEKGRFVGNVYLFHDAPFSLADTLDIDANYIAALEQNTKKSRTHLRKMSAGILREIDRLYEKDEIHAETRLGLISNILENQFHAPAGVGGFGSLVDESLLPVDNFAEIDQNLTQSKNLSPVPVDNSAETDQNPVQRKNLSLDERQNFPETDQNLTQSKNLSPVPVDNSAETDQNPVQRKNLSLDDSMRSSSSSSSSSSSNLINKKYFNIDNTTTQNQRSESETGSIRQNTSAINLPDKNTYTILLSTPQSIDDIVQSLVSTSVLSNRDLQGITRLLRYYPGINHAELIDQILGRILAHIRGYAPDKVRNPTAFFKELAAKSKKGFFNLDTFGQAMSEARRTNTKPSIPWSQDTVRKFEND